MKDFGPIIAEKPYDAMGQDFMDTFGTWVNETSPKDGSLMVLAMGLFRARLALAQKYHTFFATQVTANGTKELWKDRFTGVGNEPCYSFATPLVERTKRFWKWAEAAGCYNEGAAFKWDTNLAPFPSLPVSVTPEPSMSHWTFVYEPRFAARTGGSFKCRRVAYGVDKDGHLLYLFIHPRNQWIPQIRSEATTFWNIALDDNNEKYVRFAALASFEWLWFWMNPFMRAGASNTDALSLIMQKHIGAKTRDTFYHQDCEALLMPFDAYVEKRINDMTHGFDYQFPMEVT